MGSDPLRFANRATISARVDADHRTRQVELRRIPPGEEYQACVPSGNPETAAKLLSEIGAKFSATAESDIYKSIIGFSEVTLAGELYIDQLKAARARFASSVEEVAVDFAKLKKYTPEHAKKIIAARIQLKNDLKNVFPGATYFRSIPVEGRLNSDEITEALSKDLEKTSSLKGKTVTNLSRRVFQKGSQELNYADDIAVKLDLKVARKLKLASKILVPLDFLPPLAVLLTTDNEAEIKKALIQFHAIAVGKVAGKVAAGGVIMLCTVFGVGTLGWGFLVCGVGALAADIIAGDAVEQYITPMLSD